MKEYIMKIISAATAACILFSLSACGNKTPSPEKEEEPTFEKSATSQTVKIASIPTDETELADMLNAAVNYVDQYCYKYKKTVKCDASVDNVGLLSSVSNVSDAFASVFGEKDISAEYDYNTDSKLFANNFVKGPIDKEYISSISAKQEDNLVVLTAELNAESDPTDESGILNKLGGDYISAAKVTSSLGEFKSTASSVSVSADGISITARISVDDSSLKSMTVSYTERFNLSGVTLVKIKGGAVSGSAKTVVEYTNFG